VSVRVIMYNEKRLYGRGLGVDSMQIVSLYVSHMRATAVKDHFHALK